MSDYRRLSHHSIIGEPENLRIRSPLSSPQKKKYDWVATKNLVNHKQSFMYHRRWMRRKTGIIDQDIVQDLKTVIDLITSKCNFDTVLAHEQDYLSVKILNQMTRLTDDLNDYWKQRQNK